MASTLEIVPTKTKSLDELWFVWLKFRGDVAPNTYAMLEWIRRKFIPFMANKPVTLDTMLAWILHLRESKLHPSTFNKINKWVGAFLRWLKQIGYIDIDVRAPLKCIPTPLPKEPPLWKHWEYEKVKEFCKGREWCQPYLWLFILSYRTGMNLKDCCYLRWRDVHLNENGPSYIDMYRIKTVKMGHKARCQIPIVVGSDLHEWLLKLKAVEHLNYKRFDGITDFVHQDCPGYFECTMSLISQKFKKIFRSAKIDISDGKRFMHLRHTFCSNLVNSGANHALICKMTGHNNMKTLLFYLKPDRMALQGVMEKAYDYAGNNSPVKIIDENKTNAGSSGGAIAERAGPPTIPAKTGQGNIPA